jgi:hypothetical protein
MAKVPLEYFAEVLAADAYAYGYDEIRDFLTVPYPAHSTDWVITNPPFRLSIREPARVLGSAFGLPAHPLIQQGF